MKTNLIRDVFSIVVPPTFEGFRGATSLGPCRDQGNFLVLCDEQAWGEVGSLRNESGLGFQTEGCSSSTSLNASDLHNTYYTNRQDHEEETKRQREERGGYHYVSNTNNNSKDHLEEGERYHLNMEAFTRSTEQTTTHTK